MKASDIALSSFIARGGVLSDVRDNILSMETTRTIQPACQLGKIPVNSYIYLPEKYRLPLRIDMTVKIDSPEFTLLVGVGHVNFGTPWSHNRRIDDIIDPAFKPRFFDNRVPLNEFFDISLIFLLHEMQILVDQQERFYSKKERYMKSELFQAANEEGFEIKLTCSKRTRLWLKSFRILTGDDVIIVHANEKLPEPITRNEAVRKNEKPTFAACISLLSNELKDEIIKTDRYILGLQPLNMKRKVEENKIVYVSSGYGFSYTLFISNDLMHHSLNWYVIHNNKYKDKEQDYMPEVLNSIQQKSPEFAQKMFKQLRECVGPGCMDTKTYAFNGKSKKTCNGRIEFKWHLTDFEDARDFIQAVNESMLSKLVNPI